MTSVEGMGTDKIVGNDVSKSKMVGYRLLGKLFATGSAVGMLPPIGEYVAFNVPVGKPVGFADGRNVAPIKVGIRVTGDAVGLVVGEFVGVGVGFSVGANVTPKFVGVVVTVKEVGTIVG